MSYVIRATEQQLREHIQPNDSLYPLLQDVFKDKKDVKTYWSKFPHLRLLKRLGKRRLISFLFFSYLFMFSTAEFTQNIQLGQTIIWIQFVLFYLIVCSVLCFERGINNCEYTMLIPYMALVMGAVSCYVCLFGMTAAAVIRSPPFEWFLLGFHAFLFFITSGVLFILAKGTDVLWRGFFTLVDLYANRDLVEKLRTNAPMEEKKEEKKTTGRNQNKNKRNGRR